jgi:hypothetical protein
MPWEFAALDRKKKASLIAMISVKIEKERRDQAKLKRK